MSSIYEEIGGEAAVYAAVDRFYARIMMDDRINHFFEDIDMERQIKHQKAFLTYAFGGENKYRGRSLGAAHKRLVEEKGLNDTHFNAVAECLLETLKDLEVPQILIDKIMAIADSTREEVLGRS